MLANFFRNIVYPPHCIGCGGPGAWICDACRNLHLIRAPPECIVCRKVSTGYRTHETCLRRTAIRQAVICWRYNDLAKQAMKTLKYNVSYGIAKELAALAQDITSPHLPEHGILVPVPTTSSRIRERGFNQSEILAEEIQRQTASHGKYDLTVESLLIKDPRGKSQSGKSRAERLKAARGDFRFLSEKFHPDRQRPPQDTTLILVDDVCTTGTTLHHCASVLAGEGFKDIRAIALFRGKPRYSRERGQMPQELQLAHDPPHDVGGPKSPSLPSEFLPEN